MPATRLAKFDVNEEGIALLMGELDHRTRNLLMMIETMIMKTQSTNVEDYRSKLIHRIRGLDRFYQLTGRNSRMLGLAELLEHTLGPYAANGGAQVVASGAPLDLKPSLALALHLAFHELAVNARKYGALSTPNGRVKVEWEAGVDSDAPGKLAILWTEEGGPQVKIPQRRGFGSRLIENVLAGHGRVRMDFGSKGLSCMMLVDTGYDSAKKATV